MRGSYKKPQVLHKLAVLNNASKSSTHRAKYQFNMVYHYAPFFVFEKVLETAFLNKNNHGGTFDSNIINI